MLIKEMLTIREIFLGIKDNKIPISAGYQIARFLHDTDMEYEFYQTKYTEIIREYCEMDDSGNPQISEDGQGIKIQQDRIEECSERLNSLLTTEITAPVISLKIDDLSSTSLTIEQIYFLANYIKE